MLTDGITVLKPLQPGKRGLAESRFYLKVFDGAARESPPATFMPAFYGITTREEEEPAAAGASVATPPRGHGAKGPAHAHKVVASGSSSNEQRAQGEGPAFAPAASIAHSAAGHRGPAHHSSPFAPAPVLTYRSYLMLEDLTAPYRRPCVMDIKMGVQTWDEDAPLDKVLQERGKYPTQQAVGFRLTGMRVWDTAAGRYREHGRGFGYALGEDDLVRGFAEFLHDGTRLRVELIPQLLARLHAIREWMAGQAEHRCYGTSLLLLYDGGDGEEEEAGVHAATARGRRKLAPGAPAPPPRVDVRMIDFAHVWPIRDGPGGRDTGYLLGLDRVIGYLEQLQVQAQVQGEGQRRAQP
jgi:hypothetical protein